MSNKMKALFFLISILLLAQLIFPVELLRDMEDIKVFAVDKSGNIYTARGEHQIVKYSPEGKRILAMGQKGQGPGDIRRLGWFALNPVDNRIYVSEFFNGNKWISTFSPEGKYMGEWNCDFNLKEWPSFPRIACDSVGNIYLQATKSVMHQYKNFQIFTHQHVIFMFSHKGKLIHKIHSMNADFNAHYKGRGDLTIPFCNWYRWAIFKNKIVFRDSKAQHILIINQAGNVEKKIDLPFKKFRVIQKDIDGWYERIKLDRNVKRWIAEGLIDLKFWRDNLPFPEFKDVSQGDLHIDNKGFLYSRKADYDNAQWHTWAKINLETYDLSIVYSLSATRLLRIVNDTAFILVPEEEDEYFVGKTKVGDFFSTEKKSKPKGGK